MELAEHYFDCCRNAGGLSDLHISQIYNAFVDEYQNECVPFAENDEQRIACKLTDTTLLASRIKIGNFQAVVHSSSKMLAGERYDIQVLKRGKNWMIRGTPIAKANKKKSPKKSTRASRVTRTYVKIIRGDEVRRA